MQKSRPSTRILTLVVAGFVVFCGGLVIESGFFKNSLQTKQGPILLQSTTAEAPQQNATEPPPQSSQPTQQSESVSSSQFEPIKGIEKTVIIGAENPKTEDPETGFKFQAELSSKGASVRKVTFSNGNDNGFDDRDPENPQPLVLLSPIHQHVRNIKTITSGWYHVLALRIDGSLIGWGDNSKDQLKRLGTKNYKYISAGGYHNLAIKADGTLAAWGDNSFNQTDVPDGNDFTDIAAGGYHNLAIRANGSLEAWGYDKYNQASPPEGNDFKDIAAGSYHSLALRRNGSISGWGANDYDQCSSIPGGTNKIGNVWNSNSHDFNDIAAGEHHSVALKSDGSLAAWGDNSFGQTDVPDGDDFTAIAAGGYHSLAIRTDGSLVAWGDNSCGQINVPAGKDFIAIAVGYRHSVALKYDGSVVTWGLNDILPLANKGFEFVKQQKQVPLDQSHWKSFAVETSPDGTQSARFETVIKIHGTDIPVVKITKIYKVNPGSYLLDCNVIVENLSASDQKVSFKLAGPLGIGREGFRGDMRRVIGGFVTSQGQIVSSESAIMTSLGNSIRKKLGLDYKLGLKDAMRLHKNEDLIIGNTLPDSYRSADFLWAAITNKYFAAILRPVPDNGKHCDWIAQKTGRFYNPDGDLHGNTGDESIGINFGIAASSLGPAGQTNSTKEYKFQLYLGPKDRDLFHKDPLYKTLGFAHTITFTSCCCCPAAMIRPLAFGILGLMKWMYSFIPNYGVVIIILVFLMRLIMHPITKKSQVSMSKMSQLAPKAEQIKNKYANNKAEMNKRLMELYKEQGASPMMGFLPMMIQMPIWIALWTSVYTSVDLRGAQFLPFWITDLSMPDALFRFPAVTLPLLGKLNSFNLLPILMGVAFFLQQKLMPTQASAATNPQMAQQQKMMKIMMPLMFPLILYKGPSGVNLYIMASTFAGVVEQHVIRKHIREKEEAESKGLVATTKKTGGKVKKKKPKPFYKI